MTDSEFDRAIAVRPLPDAGPGTWSAQLDPGWRIGNAVNGGLLLALAAGALRHELGGDGRHVDPFAISAYYLSAALPGPATVHTQVLRQGRQVSSGQVSISQAGRDGGEVERLRALATYGDLGAAGAEDAAAIPSGGPPDMPPPERCLSAVEAPPDFLKHIDILHRLDLRIDPATAGWVVGKPSGRGEMRGWLRLPDGREPDPMMLLLAVDALPPVAFDLGLSGWTPTLELTTYVRARPAPGWLQVALSTRHHGGGFLEEDAEVWDSRGRLVAQSRQLARTATPH